MLRGTKGHRMVRGGLGEGAEGEMRNKICGKNLVFEWSQQVR